MCKVRLPTYKKKELTVAKEENDPRNNIARKNLRIAAAMREMSLAEISRQAGLSRNGLSQYINGSTSLSYANMLRICDVLQLPIGLVHKADAMTESRIRIWRALERLPDHLVGKALEEAQASRS